MTTFRQKLEQLRAIDPIAIASEAMLENQEQIIAINQYQLYEQGIGKDGQKLPPYSAPYAKIKQKQRGQSIVDIWRTGRLQSEMTMRVENGEYEISSAADYAKYVVGLRPKIFGLTEEGKRETWRIIFPSFIEKFKEKTGTL